jgi:hypothetical protein
MVITQAETSRLSPLRQLIRVVEHRSFKKAENTLFAALDGAPMSGPKVLDLGQAPVHPSRPNCQALEDFV